jgi:hypothetical protein
MKNDILRRHGGEIRRAIRNHRYEVTPGGIHIPGARLDVGGVFTVWQEGGTPFHAPNLVTNEGLNYVLNACMRGAAQVTGWHIALYANDLAPVAGLTGATFASTQNEFTNYTESTRRPWTTDGASSAQLLTNSNTPAQFTFDTGGGTVYGAALLQASAKGATTGVCFCAAPFAEGQTLGLNGKLNVQYDLEAADGE